MKPQRLANASSIDSMTQVELRRPGGKFPFAAGHVATTTLLADMQTFPLPDVLENLRAPAYPWYQT